MIHLGDEVVVGGVVVTWTPYNRRIKCKSGITMDIPEGEALPYSIQGLINILQESKSLIEDLSLPKDHPLRIAVEETTQFQYPFD